MGDWYPADDYAIPQELEIVEVVLSAERKAKQCLARKWDRRIWPKDRPMLETAAEQIAYIINVYAGSCGYRVQRLEGTPSGTSGMDETRLATLRDYYNAWIKLCKNYRIDQQAILDTVVNGYSLSRVDRNKRRRKGWAKDNLHEGMELYCEVRGWRS